ncbi:MAG: hypothetical protein PVG41_17105 [Desulfobacteraceae bacterium]|jgi:hypothetical protein
MRKIGLQILGGILAIALIWGWYVTIYVPKRLINHAVETTINASTRCEFEDEWIDADAPPLRLYESKGGLACRRIALNDTEIEICQRSLIQTARNAGVRPLKQNQLKIQVRSQKYHFNADSIIDVGGNRIAAADRDIAVASSKTHIYIGWVRQLDPAQQSVITLRVIDNRKGTQRLEKQIYRTACCLVNLSMYYDQNRSKLLFTWNNWRYPDHKNIFFAVLDVYKLLHDNQMLVPIQLVFNDKWDKRNPYFLNDNDKIYLIYTTGDHWGWLAYSGRQRIGVYTMDDAIQPVDYRIIAARNPLGKVLKIENGYLCYQMLSQDASRVEELRKIDISKTFQAR